MDGCSRSRAQSILPTRSLCFFETATAAAWNTSVAGLRLSDTVSDGTKSRWVVASVNSRWIACQRCGALHDEKKPDAECFGQACGCHRRRSRQTKGQSHSSSAGSTPRAPHSVLSCKSFDERERGAERGDPRALAAFRNLILGLPGESGGADVDKLYDLRGSFGQLALEQVTCGIDVQDDRLVYVILGFDAANAHVQVVHFGVVLGDPRDSITCGTDPRGRTRHVPHAAALCPFVSVRLPVFSPAPLKSAVRQTSMVGPDHRPRRDGPARSRPGVR